MLAGKRIVLGVSGGIAAYKAVDLASRLKKQGAEVHVIMTRAAAELVAPLTFQSISGQPVHTELLALPQREAVEHIALARQADLLLIAPATAHVIGKLAGGLADDYLTTVALAVTCPVLVCPAMNYQMYKHPAVVRNCRTLRELGYHLLEPAYGPMAEPGVGKGRLPEPADIVTAVIDLLVHGVAPDSPVDTAADWAGRTVVVTAGGTAEPLDPVRVLTNRSSGRMGVAIAEAARDRGAHVILIHGQVTVPLPLGVTTVAAETATAMRDAVLQHYEQADVIVKAAAVSDWRPEQAAPQKLKKQDGVDAVTFTFVRNPDILAELGTRRRASGAVRPLLVGFAAETEDAARHGVEKAARKGADLVVANDVSRPDSGFGRDTNKVWFCTADGTMTELPVMSKRRVAERLLDLLGSRLAPAREQAAADGR